MNLDKTYKNAKLVFLGDTSVGKSSIASRFAHSSFTEYRESTIGAAFLTKQIDIENATIKFEIWDTAGQERYRSLAPMYYRGASVAIITYDITNLSSYKSAKMWIKELNENLTKDIVIALVGNKLDMNENREVNLREASNFADTENLLFYEVSAKNDININELFEKVGTLVSQMDIPTKKITEIKFKSENKYIKSTRCC